MLPSRRLLVAAVATVATVAVGCAGARTVGSIGAVLGRNADTGAVHVREVPDGHAADLAGLAPGDEIVFVDGRDVRDLDVPALRELLRGEPGSHVDLTLLRGGRVVRVRVARAPLVTPIARTPEGEQEIEE